jgi:transposase
MTNTPTTLEPTPTAGVDTHKDTHHTAVLDHLGRTLATHQFPATTGYSMLLTWLTGFGVLTATGIEGTGSSGAGLTRYPTAHGLTVIEVDRPDRNTHGTSDPIHAIAAAQAVLSRRAQGTPTHRTGPVEAIRVLHTVRVEATTARTAALKPAHRPEHTPHPTRWANPYAHSPPPP